MGDILDDFVKDAQERLCRGYYKVSERAALQKRSLVTNIRRESHAAVIAELKAASPLTGILRADFYVEEIATGMERGGAAGLSVVTMPQRFNGHLTHLVRAKSVTNLPVLMKDFIVEKEQLNAASMLGADAVLLIYSLFERGYVENDVETMIAYAHALGLEVLLETHSEDEYLGTMSTSADMVGVNNRDLASLRVDLNVTRRALALGKPPGKTVVSESGITRPEDIRSLKALGVDAFLVGSAVVSSEDIEDAVRRFVEST